MSDQPLPNGIRLKQDASIGDNLRPETGATVTANLVAQFERMKAERDKAFAEKQPLQNRIQALSDDKANLMHENEKLKDTVKGRNMEIGRLKAKLGIK